MMPKKDSAYFDETKARMKKGNWGPHAIRLMFNNGIVEEYNSGRMTLVEAKVHFPAIEQHPLFNPPLVNSPPGSSTGNRGD